MIKTIGALFLTACAAHAGLVVLPNGDASANGNNFTVIPLGSGSTGWAFQWDISGSQMGSVPVGSSITAIGFRLEGSQGTGPASPETVGTFDLQLSTSLNALGSLSTTEANNIGSDAVTVLSGGLTIPTDAFTGGTGPNPFYLIDFTTPYTYEGGDLLFSLSVNNIVGALSLDANNVDANGDTVGAMGGGAGRSEFYNYPTTELEFTAGTSTPEPSSLLLLGAGLAFLAGRRLRVSQR
jgi:hypothetical protein